MSQEKLKFIKFMDIGNEILKFNVIPFLDNPNRHQFNIAYHKFSVIIETNKFYYKNQKLTTKDCLPSEITLIEQQYNELNLHWKHTLSLISTSFIAKIKSTTLGINFNNDENFDKYKNMHDTEFNYEYYKNSKIEIKDILDTLYEFDYFGCIVLYGLQSLKNLRVLSFGTITCDISNLQNLKILSVYEYLGQLPQNLIEYNCENLLAQQTLPSKLEELNVRNTIIYNKYWYAPKYENIRRNSYDDINVNDFLNERYKDYQPSIRDENIVVIPHSIKYCKTSCPVIYIS